MKKINQIYGQLGLFDASIFKECFQCWCRDCKYNEVGEGIPRNFMGVMKPCPACISCQNQGVAEVCEIGSPQNGCMTRAKEEGLL
jgi:hypothetical protein